MSYLLELGGLHLTLNREAPGRMVTVKVSMAKYEMSF